MPQADQDGVRVALSPAQPGGFKSEVQHPAGLISQAVEKEWGIPIRHAEEEERDLVANVLARGFSQDGIMRSAYPDESTRAQGMLDFFSAFVDYGFQCGRVMLTENKRGAYVYFPPSAQEASSPAAAELDRRLVETAGPNASTVARLIQGIDAHHPKTPHYYLFCMAALAEFAHGGYGMAFVRHLNATADAAALPCYAEATSLRSRSIFHSQGYKDAGEPIALDGFPPIYPVWRDPGQA